MFTIVQKSIIISKPFVTILKRIKVFVFARPALEIFILYIFIKVKIELQYNNSKQFYRRIAKFICVTEIEL